MECAVATSPGNRYQQVLGFVVEYTKGTLELSYREPGAFTMAGTNERSGQTAGLSIVDLKQQIARLHEQLERAEEEAALRERIAFTAGLFQSNFTVHSLLESLADGVVIVDFQSRILLLNPKAEEIFGYQESEVLGKPLSLLLPEEKVDIHEKHLQAFFENPSPRPMGAGLDLHAVCQDGSRIPVEVSLSYIENDYGRFAVAYVADVSMRKQWESDLQTRNQELDTFSHMVAHDLKSSLALMIGFGELLQADFRTMPEPEIDETLDAIVRGGHRMNAIVQELLLFARLREEVMEIETVDSLEIIYAAMSRLSREIEESGARIEVPQDFVPALGYGPWLEEVWLNYLGNAIKYGGDPPVIRVGSEKKGRTVRFWVRDNGDGLTDRQQMGLFEPFARRHSGAAQGHGLGLSIVRRIVARLGGDVGVKSAPNRGSTFYFTLPAADTGDPA